MSELWNSRAIEKISQKTEDWQNKIGPAEKGEEKGFNSLSGLPIKPFIPRKTFPIWTTLRI